MLRELYPNYRRRGARAAWGSLWEDAGDLGFALARKGLKVKSLDLLIAAYPLTHAVPILTIDRDFQLIARTGVGLHLVDG